MLWTASYSPNCAGGGTPLYQSKFPASPRANSRPGPPAETTSCTTVATVTHAQYAILYEQKLVWQGVRWFVTTKEEIALLEGAKPLRDRASGAQPPREKMNDLVPDVAEQLQVRQVRGFGSEVSHQPRVLLGQRFLSKSTLVLVRPEEKDQDLVDPRIQSSHRHNGNARRVRGEVVVGRNEHQCAAVAEGGAKECECALEQIDAQRADVRAAGQKLLLAIPSGARHGRGPLPETRCNLTGAMAAYPRDPAPATRPEPRKGER